MTLYGYLKVCTIVLSFRIHSLKNQNLLRLVLAFLFGIEACFSIWNLFLLSISKVNPPQFVSELSMCGPFNSFELFSYIDIIGSYLCFFSASQNAVEVNLLKYQREKLRDALELHCPVCSD